MTLTHQQVVYPQGSCTRTRAISLPYLCSEQTDPLLSPKFSREHIVQPPLDSPFKNFSRQQGL